MCTRVIDWLHGVLVFGLGMKRHSGVARLDDIKLPAAAGWESGALVYAFWAKFVGFSEGNVLLWDRWVAHFLRFKQDMMPSEVSFLILDFRRYHVGLVACNIMGFQSWVFLLVFKDLILSEIQTQHISWESYLLVSYLLTAYYRVDCLQHCGFLKLGVLVRHYASPSTWIQNTTLLCKKSTTHFMSSGSKIWDWLPTTLTSPKVGITY